MAVQIQMRRDVAADWTSANPVLAEGELGLETDTAKWKIGDGATAWTSLGYANQVVAGPASVSNSGASPALTITNTGSGNSLLVEDSASTDSTPFVIDASGNVGIGVTPATLFHTESDTASNDTRLAINNTSANPATIRFTKRRGTAASKTVVANADQLGAIYFSGYDGAADQFGAAIIAGVDATPGAGDMPGRLLFYTTADGGTSLTERMRINSAGLITGTGTSLGAWTAYTPTLGGGWAIGNGTLDCSYAQIGKIVFWKMRFIFGTTSIAGGSPLTMTLPVTGKSGSQGQGTSRVYDASAGLTYYHAFRTDTANNTFTVLGAGGVEASYFTTANPITFAAGDQFYATGTYEAA